MLNERTIGSYLLYIKISGKQWHERWVNLTKGKDDFHHHFHFITKLKFAQYIYNKTGTYQVLISLDINT